MGAQNVPLANGRLEDFGGAACSAWFERQTSLAGAAAPPQSTLTFAEILVKAENRPQRMEVAWLALMQRSQAQ
jgi:hypothetical protein